ncbi:MAG TPA: hypothetical protein VKA23_04015 [Mariprofundaceae bacterium]|nr:hypothetical protein [Mariprofundaceae bacterium]
MSFDWFLILLPVVLAIGALVKVLTSRPPAYQRKRKQYSTSSTSGDTSDVTMNINDSSSGSRNKQGGDAPEIHSDGGGDGGGD